MNKIAGIRNEQKKHPFFYRKLKPVDTDKIFFIKTPNILVGEINIPQNEKQPGNDDGQKIRFPETDEVHPPPFKTEKERHCKTCDVQKKVIILFQKFKNFEVMPLLHGNISTAQTAFRNIRRVLFRGVCGAFCGPFSALSNTSYSYCQTT